MKKQLKMLAVGVALCCVLRPFGVTPDLAFVAGIAAGTLMTLIQRDVFSE